MAKPRPTAPFAATRAALAHDLGQIDAMLPGSIVTRHVRCGKRNCACNADPPQLHGPYIQWTRNVNGKTVTRLLTTEQLARYQPWFDNARRAKDLTGKIEAASIAAFDATEGKTPRKNQKPDPARP